MLSQQLFKRVLITIHEDTRTHYEVVRVVRSGPPMVLFEALTGRPICSVRAGMKDCDMSAIVPLPGAAAGQFLSISPTRTGHFYFCVTNLLFDAPIHFFIAETPNTRFEEAGVAVNNDYTCMPGCTLPIIAHCGQATGLNRDPDAWFRTNDDMVVTRGTADALAARIAQARDNRQRIPNRFFITVCPDAAANADFRHAEWRCCDLICRPRAPVGGGADAPANSGDAQRQPKRTAHGVPCGDTGRAEPDPRTTPWCGVYLRGGKGSCAQGMRCPMAHILQMNPVTRKLSKTARIVYAPESGAAGGGGDDENPFQADLDRGTSPAALWLSVMADAQLFEPTAGGPVGEYKLIEDAMALTLRAIRTRNVELVAQNLEEGAAGVHNGDECAICLEGKPDFIAVPCGHRATHARCQSEQRDADARDRCVMCRGRITHKVHTTV